jgi:TetR/AcrR family transcriptional repressor of mexJK operon
VSRIKSEIKRTAIINGAKSLFLTNNYSDVSMVTISASAGVSKNTVYGHFKDKEDLFKQVILEHWKSGALPTLDIDDNRDISEVLIDFSKKFMDYLYHEDTLAIFRTLIAVSGRFPELVESIVQNEATPALSDMTEYLSKNSVNASIPAKQAAIYLFGLLKEDAFWHVLAGFRKPYSTQALDTHIKSAVKTFLKAA